MTKQTIDQLKKRYSKFHEQKIRVQAELEGAQKRLKDLQKQAKEEFGTHNINELTEKLATMKSSNEQKRQSYQESLDKIETELAQVEADFERTTADEESE